MRRVERLRFDRRALLQRNLPEDLPQAVPIGQRLFGVYQNLLRHRPYGGGTAAAPLQDGADVFGYADVQLLRGVRHDRELRGLRGLWDTRDVPRHPIQQGLLELWIILRM